MNPNPIPSAPRRRGAFTFVEMLVAMAISAMFIGTAALAMQAIGANSKRFSSIQNIAIGTSAAKNYYGVSSTTVRAPAAPNFGRLGYAMEIRQMFLEDTDRSEAVYCLARSGLNTVRPEWLPWPHAADPLSAPDLDTPEAFRRFLAVAAPTSAGIFETYRNVPSAGAPNVSVFLLGPTDQSDYIRVNAVYDIDYVKSTSPAGLYASVRRYKNGAMTHYYDIFYEDGPGDPFSPALVAFERQALLAVDEADTIDRFKVAKGSPFYFLWWPDPSINPLQAPKVARSTNVLDPRQAYGHLAGKTGFFFTVPMFPSF